MNKTSLNLFLEYNISIISEILHRHDLAGLLVKRVYESDSFIDDYIPQVELQKPESTMLGELREELPNLRMLDIGVGVGRTTKYFARLAKEYVGIDYSINMIKTCRRRYPNLRLEVADARNLSLFKDASFDFVMFSFNGIDSVEHEERLVVLSEIRRVLSKNGYFCFSTLNLDSWRLKPLFKSSRKPRILCRSTYNFLLNYKVWRSIKQSRTKPPQHMMVYFTYKDFLLRNYFITPGEQLKQLENAGFSDTKVYDLNSGNVVVDPTNMLDYWVYFLTRAK